MSIHNSDHFKNRFPASLEDSDSEVWKDPETDQQRRSRLYKQAHHATSLDALPTDTRYWGITVRTITYDSGYGDRGQSDMTTDHSLQIAWFDTEEALQDWVLQCVERRESYKVFRAEPVKTEVKAVFSIVK